MFEQGICAFTHVQNNRQLVLSGEPELGSVDGVHFDFSARCLQPRHKAIDANFPNRHQARIAGQIAQSLIKLADMRFGGIQGKQGMYAQRVGVTIRVRPTPHRFKVADLNGGNNAQLHASRLRLGT